MTNKEKLAILNSMEVVDSESAGGELISVLVEYSSENLRKLARIVPDMGWYLENEGDPDHLKQTIDISTAAFVFSHADYYLDGKFKIFTKERLIEMYQEERTRREMAERKLKELKTIEELEKRNTKLDFEVDANTIVKVKLTDLGETILREQHNQLQKTLRERGVEASEFGLNLDKDGYYSTQLWSLMNRFGHVVDIGMELPFYSEIIIKTGTPL